MSVFAIQAVLEKSRAEKGARLVLLALAWHADNQTFWCWPSIERIQKETLLGRTAVSTAIGKLIELGEVMIQEQAGPNGVNKYLVLLCTNGRITSHLPGQKEDSKPKSVRKVNTPKPDGESVHKRLGTLDDEDKGGVEWPSEEDVLQFAKDYPGNMSKGIPAVIPEAWARYHWHFRTYERRDWDRNWKKALVSRFEISWVNGDRYARGEAKKTAGIWETTKRLEELRRQVAQHPANEGSSSWLGEPDDDEKSDYEKLRDEIRKLEQQISGGDK